MLRSGSRNLCATILTLLRPISEPITAVRKIFVYELREKHKWSSRSVFFSWYCLGDWDLQIQNSRDVTPCRSAKSYRIQIVLHWIGKDYDLSKRRWVFTSRQRITSQKTWIFGNTALRNSELECDLHKALWKLQELQMLRFNIKFGIHVRLNLISQFICNKSQLPTWCKYSFILARHVSGHTPIFRSK